MPRVCLWYSKFGVNVGPQRGNQWKYFLMWWTAELVKGPSLHRYVWFSPFLPPCNMLKRAVSLVITGDQTMVLNHLQGGGEGKGGTLHSEDLSKSLKSERKKDQRDLLCFLCILFFCCMWKHQEHAVGHVSYSWLHGGQLWKVSHRAIKSWCII